MDKTPFIAVEGPIGVGKTSLAKAISEEYDYHLLKEIVEENPFLGKFYDDIEEWSFQTEMFFLCNRFKQLEDIERFYLKHGKPVVSDYHIFKNRIFAMRTLKEVHFQKYMQIFEIITKDMPAPNMVIYIKASLETLLKRISLRGRDIEKNISPDYLKRLSSDYEIFMYQFQKLHPDIPVLTIDGDKTDFVQNQDQLSEILKMVEETFHKKEVKQ
ncbi:deoxynucleoside kinase [Pseudalkalibacillus salsuginis]|uniref:deoxynucleoside kinase n=1 Tax=Pseudalkalibacillus salsuginis TaxID=2910972 RepID=UPI001F40324E|nr:deoxynucleoside kinase [Pseudalkalibacillus salsuginis]MCF6411960.1 deoxynucleoside kinase [Pseudalkalibacillus salsuginis]